MPTILIIILCYICLVIGFAIAAILSTAKEADRREEIVVGYDKANEEDISCLTIAKKIDDNIIVQEIFIGKEVDVANRVTKVFEDYHIYKKERTNNGK